jgi:ABC-type lipoprotein release transport system permease subunit
MVCLKAWKAIAMYIVAIAWLYVVFMMSITERTAVAGVMTFLLYGVFPLTIVLYLMGTPQRKRNRQLAEKNKAVAVYGKSDAESDTESHADPRAESQAESHTE